MNAIRKGQIENIMKSDVLGQRYFIHSVLELLSKKIVITEFLCPLNFFATKPMYPSELNISKLISQPGYFREKEVRAALRKAKQKLGIKK